MIDTIILRIAIVVGLVVLYFIGYTKGQNDAYDNIIERLSEGENE